MKDRTQTAGEIPTGDRKRTSLSTHLPANTDALETNESRQAYDLLPDLTKEEWRRVHLVTRYGRLIQGAEYFDLRNPARGEFIVHEPTEVHSDDMYVAKHEVDSEIWDRLLSKV
ncbi:hypothetical protein CCAX7_48350 [Capsulimonas corticalis]|uniref:Uncharacterized protein n=1 Tax=Capsulimonas corticalis TaxID=2219043 RepID=A0A402CQA1_9BACT|nr:hypothetical protein [Capsulimonas corticalis]BDI32784.1 hypothetical protein CCAX7_48350 [Capsulimonas corticalis]